eukprot:scaffold69_cov248-Pinguiococcus_pyrenoidosus.AAC.12
MERWRETVIDAACPVGNDGVSRRELAIATAGAWFSGVTIAAASGVPTLQNVEALGEKAKRLRSAVRKDGADSKERVLRELKVVLKPLQEDMEAVAGGNKQAKTQALLMKGHLLELEQAVRSDDWQPYRSKTTGGLYPGGKPERELEEVEETLEDFLKLF